MNPGQLVGGNAQYLWKEQRARWDKDSAEFLTHSDFHVILTTALHLSRAHRGLQRLGDLPGGHLM